MRTVSTLIGAATVLAMLTPVLPAAAATTSYYVAPGGSDSASGRSPHSAFATIQKALDVAPTGSRIVLARGHYLQDAVSRRDGVTLTGPKDAVVQGSGHTSRIIEIRHDDMTIAGFTIDGLVGPADKADSYRDKLIYVMSTVPGDGVENVRITRMTLANAGGECVRLRYLIIGAEVDHNVVGPCGVHDFVFGGGGKNGEGIYLGTAPEQQGKNGAPDARPDVSRDNRIHHNRIDTQGNECVDIKENSTANVVDHNDCTGQLDPKSAGLDSRGSGNSFLHNRVHDNLGAGIRFGGDLPSDGTMNVAVGNIVRRNDQGGIKFQATPQGAVCGNQMSDNRGGDAVGTYRDLYAPGEPCR